MKRLLLIVILLAVVWVLSYALAFVLRTPGDRGFRYPPDGRLDRLLYPTFHPLYRLHGLIDAKRPTHERDR